MADNRRRSTSLISFPPEMTANGHVTVSRYPRMRPALAASASREHLALSLVTLHHHGMKSSASTRSLIELCIGNKLARGTSSRYKKPKYTRLAPLDARALMNPFCNCTGRQKFLLCLTVNFTHA